MNVWLGHCSIKYFFSVENLFFVRWIFFFKWGNLLMSLSDLINDVKGQYLKLVQVN